MNKEITTYQELIAKTETGYASYSDLLLTKEWLYKRQEILNRDGTHCTKCGHYETLNICHGGYAWVDYDIDKDEPKLTFTEKPYWMEVHHKYYVLNRLPWQYDNNALTTLCNWCHLELHQNETVNVYPNDVDHDTLINLGPCHRCGGEGWFPKYEHVESGICFRCRGTKYELPLIDITKANQ